MKYLSILLLPIIIGATACSSQNSKESARVQQQQGQYAIGQPVPVYDFSLERDLLIQLYNIRNQRVSTHSVWRSNYGSIEGDCASMGYGLPYDTSLTNPLMATGNRTYALTSVSQPEPNGIFASTNTSATWVMCVGEGGLIEPHYIESKVTVYPGPVTIDYATNRVQRAGKANVWIKKTGQ